MRRSPSKLVLPWHEPLPLSKSAGVGGWRFMEKWFSGREFVAARDARRHFGFVGIVIAGSATAAMLAARTLDACNAPPPSTKSGGPTRSSRPATRLPATSRAGTRDGSRFPFSHFSGTIRLWRIDHPAGSGSVAIAATRLVGKPTRSLVALLHLWPLRPVRQSFPTDSTTKVSLDDQSRNPRTDSPLLLRRTLEDRHHRTSPGRPPRHRTARD